MAPFVVVYGVLFVYPTVKMVAAQLHRRAADRPGQWVGFQQLRAAVDGSAVLDGDLEHGLFRACSPSFPARCCGLVVALGVNRLKGWLQSLVLAAFFLPYILPVSVVFRIWGWMFDKDFGIAQYVDRACSTAASTSRSSARIPLFMPAVAFVTVWWLLGFNVLLFIAGLRNISSEIYEAAALDGAGRWTQFRRITWPLIWPVTVLVLTIQLILQLKIFDQVYLFSNGGRADPTMVMVQYIYKQAFQQNHGGLAAAAVGRAVR